ncbi:metallophosphoesterase [Marinospirillum sp.]|uniref:metallophosphoesterase n=1 Tax=Marinospirillum sp. TaxID=2183934 RepID=UPI00384C805D
MLDHLPENTQGRDFLIGDLHGYHQVLMQALDEVVFDFGTDRLISVGDLIDRGPDSEACLKLLEEPWFFGVQGNHERFLLCSVAGDEALRRTWMLNGGRWSSHYSDAELQQMADLIDEKMPLALELTVQDKRLGIIHAEVPEDNWQKLQSWTGEISSELVDILTTRRQRIRNQLQFPVQNIDAVACGHTLVETPLRLGNVHCLETGICAPHLGGYLTLIEARDLLLP